MLTNFPRSEMKSKAHLALSLLTSLNEWEGCASQLEMDVVVAQKEKKEHATELKKTLLAN